MQAVNTHTNPHKPWPIEELCCSFHYPTISEDKCFECGETGHTSEDCPSFVEDE